jgi:hypothetical protein
MLGAMLRALLGSSPARAAQVCANGHVVQPSWDVCPWCSGEDLRESHPGKTNGTVILDGRSEKRSPVCGWLVALNGPHEGEDFRLRLGRNVVGTAADCDVVLSGRKISRKHCAIRFEGGEFQIADLDSTNGTWVNAEQVQRHDLIDNDLIKIGDVEFEFKCRALRQRRADGG